MDQAQFDLANHNENLPSERIVVLDVDETDWDNFRDDVLVGLRGYPSLIRPTTPTYQNFAPPTPPNYILRPTYPPPIPYKKKKKKRPHAHENRELLNHLTNGALWTAISLGVGGVFMGFGIYFFDLLTQRKKREIGSIASSSSLNKIQEVYYNHTADVSIFIQIIPL